MKSRKISEIDTIVVHHSGFMPKEGQDDVCFIDKLHKDRGWEMSGYNFYLKANGEIQASRPLKYIPAHCLGHNTRSIGVCLGGLGAFTGNQYISLYCLLDFLVQKYSINPDKIYRHNDLNPKTECIPIDLAHFVDELKKKYN